MIRDGNYDLAKYRIKISHFTEQGYDIEGVIHGGANDGEEVQYYQMMGIDNIICFEPYREAAALCRETYPGVPCFELALANHDGRGTLNIALGDGKGSSLLPVIEDHPEVTAHWDGGQGIYVGTQSVKLSKFSTWAKKHPEYNLNAYDCLVLDTQGNELEILKGMGDYLQGFKYLSIELSTDPVYAGEPAGQLVVDWLVERGFTQDSPLQSHNDVFFVRSDIKPESDLTYRGRA